MTIKEVRIAIFYISVVSATILAFAAPFIPLRRFTEIISGSVAWALVAIAVKVE